MTHHGWPTQSDSTFSSSSPQISSVTSMSFLTDQNLTFHRFSDGTITGDARKAADEHDNGSVWTTGTVLDYSAINPTLLANDSATSTAMILSPADSSSTGDCGGNKRYSTYSSTCNNSTATTTHNGSTTKLIQVKREDSSDSKNKQVSCASVVTFGFFGPSKRKSRSVDAEPSESAGNMTIDKR